MIRVLAVALVLLTAACTATADPAPVTPTQAASTPQAGPGRYTRIPDPCSLLTAEQVGQLVPLAQQGYSNQECTWSTWGRAVPENSGYRLKLAVHLAGDIPAAVASFNEEAKSENAVAWLYGKQKVSAVPGVGDQALSRETLPSTFLIYRLSNAVITISYGRAEPDKPVQADSRLPGNARKAALWVAQAMDRPAPAANPQDGRFAAAPYACTLLEDGAPVSATVCKERGVTVQVRHAPPWQGKSGIAVAKEMFAHYRTKPFKRVKGLGDEAFVKKDTMWIRVSNLVLTMRSKSGGQALAAEILDRL